MKQRNFVTAVALFLILTVQASAQREYFPPAGAWDRRTPEQAKFDAAKLK